MCGILIAFAPGQCDTYLPALNKGLMTLSHRGPDNTSRYFDKNVYLGHTRLSIFDTSTAANQPYRFENLIMVYNGEVFNYLELRQTLIEEGYAFVTGSDTEVIIKAFHCFGVECFSQFNGMWSLAIYDLEKDELLICRDRFGQKPLFIAKRGNSLFAASELQALAKILDVQPNFAAIESFLKEGDFDVNGNTFFLDFFEFPKAKYLQLTTSDQLSLKTYWEYPSEVRSSETTANQFNTLLEDAVLLRLRTDVDYSLLLSGGCDSTILSGITRKLIGENAKLTAFTYSSGDKHDEVQYSNEVARRLQIDLDISKQDEIPEAYIERLRRLVRHLGRGHASPAVISVDYLYGRVHDHGFKVALDGQGADELLAGYTHYHFHLLLDLIRACQWRQMIAVIRDVLQKGVVSVMIMALRNSLPSSLRKMLRTLYGYERFFSNKFNQKLQPNFLTQHLKYHRSQSTLNKYLIKQHNVGLSNLLYYGDIVAMANSVENRSPFMDHRLVEMVFSAGFALKVDKGRDKAVLRMHPIYSEFRDVLERSKIGFISPIAEATKKKLVEELKRSSILDWHIFNKVVLLSFLDSKDSLSEKYERFLFRLFQVHLWDREFISR